MEEDKPNSSAPEPQAGRKPDSSAKSILLSVVVAVSILLVAGGAFFLGIQKRNTGSENEETATEAVTEPTETEEAGLAGETEEAVTPTPTAKPTVKPTPTPTPTPTQAPVKETKTFDSSATNDGFQASNGGGNSSIEVRVGRNSSLIIRGFVSFGIGEIPEGATITKATLRLYQAQTLGNPYGAGVRVMLDHLDYGLTFENADYNATSISSSFATLSDNSTVGWKEAEVTDRVRDDLVNNRERSQYRLHLATETIGGTIVGDYAYFESQNNSLGTGNTPKLVVEYSYFE